MIEGFYPFYYNNDDMAASENDIVLPVEGGVGRCA